MVLLMVLFKKYHRESSIYEGYSLFFNGTYHFGFMESHKPSEPAVLLA